ncbi:MAG: HAD family hydrolase [Christensenellaceae bacterium]|jgi:phosphoglycolate phosphatase|nr:HAD family hydrolase [Christensenellaceae bacterium]
MQAKYSHVLWDWNGTLLNDLNWAMASINQMLKKRSLPELPSIAAYHAVFGFPVIDYYRRAGFDLERELFPALAAEYMAIYHGGDGQHCALQAGAAETLRAVGALGVSQVLLSASEEKNLLRQLRFFGAEGFFDEVLGLSDIYAASKAELGLRFVQRVQPKKALLVGDTEHDFLVAKALGAGCLLFSGGHESREKLLRLGPPVIDSLGEIPAFLCEEAAQ